MYTETTSKMALEHPQKQYRYGQDDSQICIILSSHKQGTYLLYSLLCSKEKFTTSGGRGGKKNPTLVYQADGTITTNYRITR